MTPLSPFRFPLPLLVMITTSLVVDSFVPTSPFSDKRLEREGRFLEVAKKEAADESVTHSPVFVRNSFDGSTLLDQNDKPVTVDRMLATKPLRSDLLTRPGPGRRELVYLTGESVIGSLNQIFGHDGWNLQVLEVEQVLQEKAGDRWNVAYMAHVRITLTATGTYREDYGTGDSMDRNMATASQMALKGSITDAMKRTARHFGDKLGNCLYRSDFNIDTAPKTLYEALERAE